MKTLTDHLVTYATYHRDRRNIATHFLGIPMIVVAVVVLLSRPSMTAAGLPLSPALAAVIGSALYYLALDLRYGVVMGGLLALTMWPSAVIASQSTGLWLAVGLGLFVVGWIVQFVGHIFEGKKPAFVDDLIGLLIGPLFVVAEAGFALGMRSDLHETIVERAGPTRNGRSRTVVAS